MKIAFFSNYLNHHQLPFCQSLMSIPKVEFKFVAWQATEKEKLNMGYADMNNQYPFVIKAYENEEEAFKIAREYDVVLIGDTLSKYIDARMNEKKLTFRVSERPLKKGNWRRFIPQTRKKLYQGYIKYKNDNMYLLGSSAYAASDVTLCGFNSEKCFSWGYFPPVIQKDMDELFHTKEKDEIEILYAGRLLSWKRVLDTVKALHILVKKGIRAHLTIVGKGECEMGIRKYILTNKLEKYATVLPFMPPENVRTYMEKSDVYVLGSNFYEGWGAVVNEAMNSGCVTIVSHAVGSAPYLIKDGENGFIYKCGNVKQLAEIISKVAKDPDLRRRIGENAYKTLNEEWSAKIAAERFYELACAMLRGEDYKNLFESGPCSVAKLYKNNWIKFKR